VVRIRGEYLRGKGLVKTTHGSTYVGVLEFRQLVGMIDDTEARNVPRRTWLLATWVRDMMVSASYLSVSKVVFQESRDWCEA
jgi:hypothetical protein